MKRLAIALMGLGLLCAPRGASAERVNFDFIDGALSANDMSPDGRFIVGSTDLDGNGSADGAYLLDRSSGVMQMLPPEGLNAVAVSDDGSVVVGDIPDPSSAISNIAARWTAETGWESLGFLPNAGTCPSRSDAYEISADGSTVVGLSWDGCSGRGFIWTEPTGILELEPLANGGNRASLISSDGTLIGGFAQGTGSRTPAIWSNTREGQLLHPAGDAVGEIFGISDDGSTLLGNWVTEGMGLVALANRWVETPSGWERMQIGAGAALPGWVGKPLDIADNGTIVGFDSLLGNRRAWIQPHGEGSIIDLRNYFEANGAELPPGFLLEVAQAISADGHYIIGHGFGTGAWLATILSDCDFDGDVECNIEDLDALIMAIASGDDDPQFDLNGDGDVDLADRDDWLTLAGAENLSSGNVYLVADANLDGVVDGLDFIEWNESKFSMTGNWSMGDFDADGVTDGVDFILWNENKFNSSAALSVPEPGSFCILLASLIAVCRDRQFSAALWPVSRPSHDP